MIKDIIIPGNPVPASRVRVTRAGRYYPRKYAAWRRVAEQYLALEKPLRPPLSCPLYVAVFSACSKPRTGKLIIPSGDVDNYAKAALDAITKAKIIWTDDTQIAELFALKEYTDKEPFTRISVSTESQFEWR